MQRFIDGWHSPSLGKHMEIVTYGHYGFGLLLLPTAAADYLEYERFQLIDAISHHINSGKVKVFSINSINSESWLHPDMFPHHKAMKHQSFNHYVFTEVIPYIKNSTSNETPIIVAGASLGALHSANLFFRRPDLFDGVLAMSGDYDLTTYTKGFWNDDVYFNSPIHYLGNMHDHHQLELMRRSDHIHILTGSGAYESPESARAFSRLLDHKSIPHELDIWGPDMTHDWPTWRAMLPNYLETRF
ncbi:MAG: esterase [Saprospiraceae bacterium]|nr:esterase [Saprospiraceae bacterium]